MDEAVRRAISKWPDVPAVYGWLALDRRGRWRLRGEPIENPVIASFIARNYEHDAIGQWFFQNGPQRVFVDLDYTPMIVRVDPDSTFTTHTGARVPAIDGAWIDEYGRVLVATAHGAALIDDRDIESLSEQMTGVNAAFADEDALIAALEDLQLGGEADLRLRYAGAVVPLRPISAADVPGRFGFIPHPRSATGEVTCK